MGDQNSRRARRRQRARNNANPNLVYWMGRWMVRTITSETVDLGNGLILEKHNETWNEPRAFQQLRQEGMNGPL